MTPADDLQTWLTARLAEDDLALDPDINVEALGIANIADLTAADITLEPDLDTRIHVPKKARLLHPRMIIYDHAQALASQLGPLATPGDRVHALLSGTFILGDLLEAWIVANDWRCTALWISTLGLSANNIDSLATLMGLGYVDRLHLLVSDYCYFHERGRGGLIEYAYEELDTGDDRFQISVIGSHAKVALIETAAGARYCLHGSANLRSAAQIEQICIEHDPDLYAFHHAWMQALEAQYSTIRTTHPKARMAPKRNQWQQVINTAAPTTSANAPDTPLEPKPPKPECDESA